MAIQFKRGKSSRLNELNPTIAEGEPIFEYDTGKLKIGDGEHTYNDLPFTDNIGENTINYGKNTSAFGGKTQAGGRGYKILAARSMSTADGVGEYTLSSVEGLERGLAYSVRLSTAKYEVGNIIEIIGNDKILVDNYPNIALEDQDVTDPDSYTVENYLTIAGRPDLGDTEIGFNAHAEGESTIAQDRDTHAEGRNTKAIGQYGHAEGRNTKAGYSAHAEGRNNIAIGDMSHAEGQNTKALGGTSHAEGAETTADKIHAHAEGYKTIAEEKAHAENAQTKALGIASHSEGYKTTAQGKNSHAEGSETIAEGDVSHAEGYACTAKGKFSHAEGAVNIAGYCAHAEGEQTKANSVYSHTEGYNTIASSKIQHVQGKFNIEDTGEKYAHIVGNGHNDTERSNAHTIDWNGNAWFAGGIILTTPDKTKKYKITIDNDGNLTTSLFTEY